MASFWNSMTGWLRKSANPDWSTLERYLGWAFGGGVSASGIIVNPQNAMQAAAVYACIKVLSESVGMLPLCVNRRDGVKRTPDESHPLWELLHHQPNEYQSSVEFLECMVAHLNLRGNAYAFVLRARSGRVVELIPMHPDHVNVTQGNDGRIVYQIGTNNGSMRVAERSEVLHIKGLTLNGWLGISPIAYARESIGLALATEKFGGQLFRNGAKMGGLLKHPNKLSDDAYGRLKNSFDAATSGENAHKTALLEEGMTWEKISMNADDAQFLETRKFQRAEIAGLFRVPAHMVNDLDKATFSNIEHLGLQFVNYSLMPWLRRIEQALRRDLFTQDDKATHEIKFNPSALYRGDAASRAAYYNLGVTGGWLVRNEPRALESDLGIALNPIDGLDIPLMPLNMTDGREPPEEEESESTAAPTGAQTVKPEATA